MQLYNVLKFLGFFLSLAIVSCGDKDKQPEGQADDIGRSSQMNGLEPEKEPAAGSFEEAWKRGREFKGELQFPEGKVNYEVSRAGGSLHNVPKDFVIALEGGSSRPGRIVKESMRAKVARLSTFPLTISDITSIQIFRSESDKPLDLMQHLREQWTQSKPVADSPIKPVVDSQTKPVAGSFEEAWAQGKMFNGHLDLPTGPVTYEISKNKITIILPAGYVAEASVVDAFPPAHPYYRMVNQQNQDPVTFSLEGGRDFQGLQLVPVNGGNTIDLLARVREQWTREHIGS